MYYKEIRPWGYFEQFSKNEQSTVKIITVNDAKLSLQSHQNRDELWIIIEGNPKIVLDNQTRDSKPGDRFEIKKNQKHRIIGLGKILEISFGEFDENDIISYEDDFNRI